MAQYKKGDVVLVDDVEYTVSGPAEAYSASDADGNVVVFSAEQLASGSEDSASDPAEPDESSDPSKMTPEQRKAELAKMKKELGM